MNEDLVLAITMLIILAVVVLFIQISQQIKVKRIQKMKIQRRFGEIPDMEEVLPIERISVYHKHQGREDVDQVTWSDLSMDQVFQRIDQCDSAAGEAVLYNMLHCTDNGQAQWKELLKYYEEQAEPRKKAEAILISLGKSTVPTCELLNRQSFEYYERQRNQGLNVQIDEITLDELLSLQEPDMPAKIFSEDELKKNRKITEIENIEKQDLRAKEPLTGHFN